MQTNIHTDAIRKKAFWGKVNFRGAPLCAARRCCCAVKVGYMNDGLHRRLLAAMCGRGGQQCLSTVASRQDAKRSCIRCKRMACLLFLFSFFAVGICTFVIFLFSVGGKGDQAALIQEIPVVVHPAHLQHNGTAVDRCEWVSGLATQGG